MRLPKLLRLSSLISGRTNDWTNDRPNVKDEETRHSKSGPRWRWWSLWCTSVPWGGTFILVAFVFKLRFGAQHAERYCSLFWTELDGPPDDDDDDNNHPCGCFVLQTATSVEDQFQCGVLHAIKRSIPILSTNVIQEEGGGQEELYNECRLALEDRSSSSVRFNYWLSFLLNR